MNFDESVNAYELDGENIFGSKYVNRFRAVTCNGFAAYEVIQGQLTLGTMVAFVGYMDSLYSPLRRLVNSSTTLTQSFASMDRVFELLDEKYDIVNVPSAVQTKKLNGEVIFDNVSFRYNADEKEILHNLSLTMLPGRR